VLFTIHKNTDNSWNIVPNSGQLAGLTVGVAEGIELSSVVTNTDKIIGTIKAIWGLQLNEDNQHNLDTETLRALSLGKAFKMDAEHAVSWARDGLHDVNSGQIIKRCKKLVILGSLIFRRGNAVF
jgi:hypothetical protein